MGAKTRKNDLSTIVGASPGTVPEPFPLRLLTASSVAPEGEGWLHEIKYDGYRLTATVTGGRVRLWTRNGFDWTGRLSSIAAAMEDLGIESAAVDGELVCLDGQGRSDFRALQSCVFSGRGQLLLYLFDMIYLDGWNLTRVPLIERKKLLMQVLSARKDPDTSPLRFCDHILGDGQRVFAHACRHGLEGIVSKKVDSRYRKGRAANWLKVKNPEYPRNRIRRRERGVICDELLNG